MTDLTTLNDVKLYLGTSSPADDGLLSMFIRQASAELEKVCGRVLVAGPAADYTFDYHDALFLFLSPYEFANVTAVTNGNSQTLAIGTDIRTMPRPRGVVEPITWLEVYQDSGKIFVPSSRLQDCITVHGQIGMLTAVDEPLKLYATKIAAHLYRTRDTGAEKAFVPELGQVLYRAALSDYEWDALKSGYVKQVVM